MALLGRQQGCVGGSFAFGVTQTWANCWLCPLLGLERNVSNLSKPQSCKMGINIYFRVLLGVLNGVADSRWLSNCSFPFILCAVPPPATGKQTDHLEGRSYFFSLSPHRLTGMRGRSGSGEWMVQSQARDGKERAQAATPHWDNLMPGAATSPPNPGSAALAHRGGQL